MEHHDPSEINLTNRCVCQLQNRHIDSSSYSYFRGSRKCVLLKLLAQEITKCNSHTVIEFSLNSLDVETNI